MTDKTMYLDIFVNKQHKPQKNIRVINEENTTSDHRGLFP